MVAQLALAVLTKCKCTNRTPRGSTLYICGLSTATLWQSRPHSGGNTLRKLSNRGANLAGVSNEIGACVPALVCCYAFNTKHSFSAEGSTGNSEGSYPDLFTTED